MNPHNILAWLRGVFALALLASPLALSAQTAAWRVELNADLLAAHGLLATDAAADSALLTRGYVAFGSTLSAASKSGGEWRAARALRLRGAGHRRVAIVQLVPRDEVHWDLLDTRGRVLLSARMPHVHVASDGSVALRHFDLVVTAAMARALGHATLAGQTIGRMQVQLPGLPGALAKGQRSCRAELSYAPPGAHIDIALLDIGLVQALRCGLPGSDPQTRPACTEESTDGLVVIAPSADLGNTGDYDVPWYPKFFPAAPPHGNDQHPFLVWNAYRIDAEGRIDQLGASPVKHAFFAQNNDCDCVGDVILYRSCSDVYGAGTNDIDDALGPRSEIAPAERIWGRCGSIYDADCDGQADPNSQLPDRWESRLAIAESALLPAMNPAASYWMEAWYLARGDDTVDNSIGHVRFAPQKDDAAWSLPITAPFVPGAVLARWRAIADPVQASAAQVLTAQGRFDIASRVVALTDGRYRYDYALMNFDFGRNLISGSASDPRVEGDGALRAIEVQMPAATAVEAIEFTRVQSGAANAWLVDSPAGLVRATAPEGGDLNWGNLARLSFVSALGPMRGLVLVDAAGSSVSLWLPVPGRAGVLFVDGFD